MEESIYNEMNTTTNHHCRAESLTDVVTVHTRANQSWILPDLRQRSSAKRYDARVDRLMFLPDRSEVYLARAPARAVLIIGYVGPKWSFFSEAFGSYT